MIGHVSIRIQFGLIMLAVGASLVVCFMVASTCSDYDPVQVLAIDDGKFPA